MGKRHKHDTHHEYISTKQEHAGMKFRVFNYFVLLSMVGLSRYFDFHFTTLDYSIVVAAIVGFDLTILKQYLYDKVMTKAKH
jgi:hypothetical protein